MKISLQWIKKYVSLPNDLTPKRLAYDLTMSTVEVENYHDLATDFVDMYVAKVIEVNSHPNADKLKVVKADLGNLHGIKEIVCGGSNLYPGQNTVVAVPGASVNWHGETKKTTITLAKIRGVESFGMICASEEIGLSNLFPASDEREIIDLKDNSAKAGTPIADYLGYNDIILDIDNKSLTNRPDLWGHYGMARELSAIYKLELKKPEIFDLSKIKHSQELVKISNTKNCQRFMALLIKNAKIEQSPLWLRAELAKLGQRSINNVVDLTNYVMLDLGKPTHAFDYEQINGSLEIRTAKAEEKIKLLDGKEINLNSDTLVVADQKQVLGLAGIMGGLSSSVKENTTKILLESANFSAKLIRKTTQNYGIRTESSMRFEKGLSLDLSADGLGYLVNLLKKYVPDIEIISLQDLALEQDPQITINLNHQFIETRIGQALDKHQALNILNSLGFKTDLKDQEFSINVPSWRSTGDVSIAEDIVEEIARIIGYDNLKHNPVPVLLDKAIRQNSVEREITLRNFLINTARIQEIVTYPWVKDKYLHACFMQEENTLILSDPPAPEESKLKISLLPNMLEIIESNLRFFDSFALFEISRIYQPELSLKNNFGESLPNQDKNLIISVVAKDLAEAYFDLKQNITKLFEVLHLDLQLLEELKFQANWAIPNSTLSIITNSGIVIGSLAAVTPVSLKRAGISKAEVAICEINLTKLYDLPEVNIKYQSVPKFPLMEFDLAVIIDQEIKWADVKLKVQTADTLIKKVDFIDDYRGKQVSENKKSLVFKMLLGKDTETLTSEEANKVAEKVLQILKTAFDAELRQQ